MQRLDDAVDVVAAGSTTCALRRDQTISCWGLLGASLLNWVRWRRPIPSLSPGRALWSAQSA